jgi:uncharacterized protein DUF992
MTRISRLAMVAAMAAVGIVTFGAQPQAAGVKAGVLTCNVSSGWGFIIGASRDLRCVYTSPAGPPEHYSGSISKFGVDIGYQQSAVIVWGVIAPTAHLNPGGLAGMYGGVTGGASVGAGLGANVLVGGSGQTIALQPVSIEGSTGLNVAAGIAEITLTPAP